MLSSSNCTGSARSILALISLAGCGGSVVEEVTTADPQHLGVNLALIQKVDSNGIADGELQEFLSADHSHDLVYGRSSIAETNSARTGACASDPRVELGLVSFEVCVGSELFFREGFGGNGRTCGSCHSVSNNYTIDSAYLSSLPSDDPLFVAEFNTELTELEIPELMKNHGLILVNPDGFEQPNEKFTVRSVNHLLSLSTSVSSPPVDEDGLTLDRLPSPPLARTGWGGDGAPGDGALRDFAQGAIVQHFTRSLARNQFADFLPAFERQLDHIAAFQLSIGRMDELDLSGVQMSDEAAERGRQSYLKGPASRCNTCHNNAGANTRITDPETGDEFVANFMFSSGHDSTRPEVLDELNVPLDGGFGTEPLDLNGDGETDVFGRRAFNPPPLIEAADTGPFFHTNGRDKIEDAIRFYTEDGFGNSPSGQRAPTGFSPGVINLSEDEISEVGRFLRVLNGSFNIQIAIARVQASFLVSAYYGNSYISIQRGLIELAKTEVQDAMNDMTGVADLNLEVQEILVAAQSVLSKAKRSSYQNHRSDLVREALLLLTEAKNTLGAGMEFEIGEGVLMF